MTKNPTLRAFLQSDMRSAWCTEGSIQIYARRGTRRLDDVLRPVLDLATFTSERPGSGKLPAVFDRAEALASEFALAGVYIENVLNSRLRAFLERRGYRKLDNLSDPDDLSPCYWRPNP